MKKLFILLRIVLVLIAAAIFTPIAAVLPQFVTRGNLSTTAAEPSRLAPIANPRLPATMTSTSEHAEPVTFTTVITMNSDEHQLSVLASMLVIETPGKILCSD